MLMRQNTKLFTLIANLLLVGILTSCGNSTKDPNYQAKEYPINDREIYKNFAYSYINDEPEKIKYRYFIFPMTHGRKSTPLTERYLYPKNNHTISAIIGEYPIDDTNPWQTIREMPDSERFVPYSLDPKLEEVFFSTEDVLLDIKVPLAKSTEPRMVAFDKEQYPPVINDKYIIIQGRLNDKLFEYVTIGNVAISGTLHSRRPFMIGKNPTPTDNSTFAMPTTGKVKYDTYAIDEAGSIQNIYVKDHDAGFTNYLPTTLVADFTEKKLTGNIDPRSAFGNIYAEIKGNKFFSFKPNATVVEGGFYGPNAQELMGRAHTIIVDSHGHGHGDKDKIEANGELYYFAGRRIK